MAGLIEGAMALRQRMLASVVASPKAERKTLRGQRKAAAATAKATRKGAKAEAVRETAPVVLGWQLPVSFNQWLKWHRNDVSVVDAEKGAVSDWARIGWDYALSLDSDVLLAQASLRNEYRAYVNARFAEPIRFNGTEGNAFDKIVAREAWLERQGKHDLGLLGYSAIDRVQLAVHHAWVHRVVRWLEQTGADKAYAREMGQALRDLRSDAELRSIAESAGRSRYIVSGETSEEFPRIRKQSEAAEVSKAKRFLELRAEYLQLPLVTNLTKGRAEYKEGEATLPFEYSSWIPSVGEVYQSLYAVTKEGLRAFRNTLEGLTQDGMISDASQYVAGHRGDLAEAGLDRAIARLDASLIQLSVEDELFNRWEFDEAYITRRAVAKTALSMPSHTAAEANAKAAMQMLVDGLKLTEIREVFTDLSERAFSQLFRDSQVIATEVKATDLFITTRFMVLEEAATAVLAN